MLHEVDLPMTTEFSIFRVSDAALKHLSLLLRLVE